MRSPPRASPGSPDAAFPGQAPVIASFPAHVGLVLAAPRPRRPGDARGGRDGVFLRGERALGGGRRRLRSATSGLEVAVDRGAVMDAGRVWFARCPLREGGFLDQQAMLATASHKLEVARRLVDRTSSAPSPEDVVVDASARFEAPACGTRRDGRPRRPTSRPCGAASTRARGGRCRAAAGISACDIRVLEIRQGRRGTSPPRLGLDGARVARAEPGSRGNSPSSWTRSPAPSTSRLRRGSRSLRSCDVRDLRRRARARRRGAGPAAARTLGRCGAAPRDLRAMGGNLGLPVLEPALVPARDRRVVAAHARQSKRLSVSECTTWAGARRDPVPREGGTSARSRAHGDERGDEGVSSRLILPLKNARRKWARPPPARAG